MKNIKTILLILTFSLLIVGCNNKEKETNEETSEVVDTTDETKMESEKETEIESEKETKEETKEETEEVEKGQIIELKPEGMKDNPDSNNSVNTTKSNNELLNNKMTKEMVNKLKDFHATLVSGQNLTYDNFPTENLQAIASFEDSDSFGWIVRYGENKIGFAQYYRESTTGVIIITDAQSLLGTSDYPIKNDSAEEYKEVAKQILDLKMNSATTEFAY